MILWFILLIGIIYSPVENNEKKYGQIVETILFIKSTVYLLIFRQSSMIFKGSPNSLKESYFTGELRMGES